MEAHMYQKLFDYPPYLIQNFFFCVQQKKETNFIFKETIPTI